jgi:hypothetical protein
MRPEGHLDWFCCWLSFASVDVGAGHRQVQASVPSSWWEREAQFLIFFIAFLVRTH